MNDLISRQDAIDALMAILDKPNHAEFLYTDEICKALEELPSAQPTYTDEQIQKMQDLEQVQIQTAYEIGKAERKTERWIPCSERLPEKDGDYLTTLTDKDGNYVDVTEWQNIIGGRWIAPIDECDYCEIGNVIAWMPLPEPMKLKVEHE